MIVLASCAVMFTYIASRSFSLACPQAVRSITARRKMVSFFMNCLHLFISNQPVHNTMPHTFRTGSFFMEQVMSGIEESFE